LSDNVARHARCVIVAARYLAARARFRACSISEGISSEPRANERRLRRAVHHRNPPWPEGQKKWNRIAYPPHYRDAINFRRMPICVGITRWRLILSNHRGSQRGSIEKRKNDCNGRSSDDQQRFERPSIFNINETRLESHPEAMLR